MIIDLKKDEYVVKVIRRHLFVLFTRSLYLVFLFILPFVLFNIFPKYIQILNVDISSISFNTSLVVLLMALWTLVLTLKFFSFWTDHYLDGWIITNKRIVDIEQKGFFSRQVSNFRVSSIQDVTTDIHGIIATLLNFGDIHVQTAGTFQKFIIKSAPNPKKIRKIILSLQDKTIKQTNFSNKTKI